MKNFAIEQISSIILFLSMLEGIYYKLPYYISIQFRYLCISQLL